MRLALKNNELKVPQGDTPQILTNLFNKWGRLDWMVHCAKTYEHGNGVVKYLSRYIRGGAFKNNQLLKLTETNVRIS
ncbi:transposase [Motilimonas sp. 1_MG-2023]|uniref:transposase n=1 Tax=Motilimonas sp. 1_MG-2023 TaxID=3062672 RepID=UPI0026E1E040|nr:transposase [Motilimonas sp. 1_MG-2023]MDO6527294.1 transposase [Motilimonas sp. 1_MG-2023]